MNLTLEQFQATRTWCDDLGAYFGDGSIAGVPGFMYASNSLYIEAPAGGAGPNVYHLQLHRDEWTSADLNKLERKLYKYGCDDGHCEVAAQPAIQA